MFKRALLFVLAPAVFAQVITPPPRVVRASGEGVVTIRPDQAKLNAGVVTVANTAQEASTQNATTVDAVIKAVAGVLGTAAPIRTISYVITPNYRNQPGQAQQITGYTASNTIEITMADLTVVGRVIDAASRAGANNVSALRFLLANPEPVRQQALAAAAKQARAHADAIASGLGGRTGAVLAAQEGASVVPVSNRLGGAATEVTTPIEVGNLEVRGYVTIEVEYQQ